MSEFVEYLILFCGDGADQRLSDFSLVFYTLHFFRSFFCFILFLSFGRWTNDLVFSWFTGGYYFIACSVNSVDFVVDLFLN